MLHKKLFNVVQSCLIAAVLSLGFASLTQATDSRIEIEPDSKPQNSQPDPHQPQQAVPAQPSSETEPADGDETALV